MGSWLQFRVDANGIEPRRGSAEKICFNAKFNEYRDCKLWAVEQLLHGHTEKELKAEVDDAEENEDTTDAEWLSQREQRHVSISNGNGFNVRGSGLDSA